MTSEWIKDAGKLLGVFLSGGLGDDCTSVANVGKINQNDPPPIAPTTTSHSPKQKAEDVHALDPAGPCWGTAVSTAEARVEKTGGSVCLKRIFVILKREGEEFEP